MIHKFTAQPGPSKKMSKTETAIAILGRAPTPGQCKTRLGKHLGKQRAANIHAGLMRRTLAIAKRTGYATSLYCTPDSKHPWYSACRAEYEVKLQRQAGNNLGARMAHAAKTELLNYSAVLILGTDACDLTVNDLHDAANRLKSSDAVIAPSDDGGYVLIGLSGNHHQIFNEVDWGTSKVLQQTARNIQRANLNTSWLPLRSDIDTVTDLQESVHNRHLPSTYLHHWKPD